MKKILRTMISALSLAAIIIPPGELALASGETLNPATDLVQINDTGGSFQSLADTWARDDKMMFVPTWIDPVSGFLDGVFNMNARFDLGAKQLCVFAYDEEQVSQAQVETQIGDFQEAEWVKASSCRSFTPEHYQSIGLSSAIDKQILAHPSGVFYYAFNVERWGAEGAEWIWGRIDHHECSYNGDKEPHMSSPCYWGGDVDTNTFLLLRSGNQGTAPYIAWAEEWSQVLTRRVDDFEAEIAAWEGNEVRQNDLMKRLKVAKVIAADASDATVLQEKFQELLDRLQKKAADLAQQDSENQPTTPINPETPVNPTIPTDPETPTKPVTPVDPKDPVNPATPAKPIDSGTAGVAGSSGNNHQAQTPTQSEASVTNSGQLTISTTSNSSAPTTSAQKDNSIFSGEAKNEQNSQTKIDQRSENNTDNDLVAKDQEEIEIPALRTENEQKRWLLWLGIVIIGLASLAGWWCKRAFFTKKRQN